MSELFGEPAVEASGLYASVAPDRGVDHPDTFTYLVPRALADVRVGDRVEAPLGSGWTRVGGTVVAIDDRTDVPISRLKPLFGRKGIGVPEGLIALGTWISRYYCCPLGVVLSAMVPAAVKRETGRTRREFFGLTDAGSRAMTAAAIGEPPGRGDARDRDEDDAAGVVRTLPPKTREAWDALVARVHADGFPVERKALVSRAGLASAAPLGRLAKAGLLARFEREVVRASPLEEEARRAPDPTCDAQLTREQAAAVERIAAGLGSFNAYLLHGVTGSGKTEVYLRVLKRVLSAGGSAVVLVPEISLTPQTAGRFLARFGGDDGAKPDGVGGVAVLHSGLTASQRHRQWERIASGAARVVVGARSAVFAPFPGVGEPNGLGLIVVDEEHDGSYKQDQAPRYHARDVAIKRAQLAGCPVVLGSATPSLESFQNCRASGGGDGGDEGENDRAASGARFELIRLTKRVNDTSMPRVRVVDLNDERRRRVEDRRRLHALGPTLEAAIGETLDAGERVLLLLNRRGYAAYIACASPECGFTLSCDYCDVHLVYHKHALPGGGGGAGATETWMARPTGGGGGARQAAYVKCHHCGAMNRLPESCPESGHKLALLGFGTQRLEEELLSKFPSLAAAAGRGDGGASDGDVDHAGELVEGGALLRLDADTMHNARDYHASLERFRSGGARVLLGTQMIAKGLDFPDVTLVGVVNADTGLAIPDFRATERTFQLVSQVAGRAGRSAAAAGRSRVIVQTMDPEHPAIVAASRHDYDGFARSEVEVRASARPPLPPVGRMARLVFRDREYEKALAAGREVATAIGEAAGPELHWRGPFEAAIPRIAEHFRLTIELLAASPGPIQEVLTTLRNRKLVRSGAGMAVDVDPVVLM
jgi:primosomal protein N' (replication factor Y)